MTRTTTPREKVGLAEVRRGPAILSYFEPQSESKFCVCKDRL
jgi:hypothetical protein